MEEVEVRQFTTPHGVVVLRLDEDSEVITAETAEGERIGQLEFRYHDGDKGQDFYKATSIDTGGVNGRFLHHGVGRQMVQMFNDCYSRRIGVEPADGLTRPDGSHLTGVAPVFWNEMVQSNLAYWLDPHWGFDDIAGYIDE